MGECYANLLKQLRKAIKDKRPGNENKVLFYQHNAPAHKSVVEMAAVHDYGFTLLDHPLYSPDLAPSVYFLLPNMKKHLVGRHYWSDEETIPVWKSFPRTIMRTSIPQGSKNSSIAGGKIWTESETVLKNKSVIALANKRIVVGLRPFPPSLVKWTRCHRFCPLPKILMSMDECLLFYILF